MLQKVDRRSAGGKRDYAILLLPVPLHQPFRAHAATTVRPAEEIGDIGFVLLTHEGLGAGWEPMFYTTAPS